MNATKLCLDCRHFAMCSDPGVVCQFFIHKDEQAFCKAFDLPVDKQTASLQVAASKKWGDA